MTQQRITEQKAGQKIRFDLSGRHFDASSAAHPDGGWAGDNDA